MVSEDTQGRVTRRVCLACNREFTGIVTACPHDGTVLIPLTQDQLIGTKLADRYEILSVIGHGGMGVVYKAKHELMDRVVAIKMLQAQLISDSMSVKRFQQEAKAASRLKHPNVITLYDFGVSATTGQPYLVMDYLQGVSLAEIIKREGHVGVDRCIRIFTQACSALEHAHRQGVIHRDLKPGNIMLVDNEDEKDYVKVVDFGVAKLMPWAGEEEAQRLTQTGEVCGSPVYMSPEQCMGQKLDARSDIYTMGVVIYEALTGRLPLLGKNMVDTMSKHISEMPQPFGTVRPDLYIPERLEAVVFRALQKNPADRHQTMELLEQDLQIAVPRPGKSQGLRTVTSTDLKVIKNPTAQVPIPKAPAAKTQKFVSDKKRPPVIVAAVVALVVAIGGALAWMMTNKGGAPEKAQPAHPGSASKPAQGPDKSSRAQSKTKPARTSGMPAKLPAAATTQSTRLPIKPRAVSAIPAKIRARTKTAEADTAAGTIAPSNPGTTAGKARAAGALHPDPFDALKQSRSY